MRSGNAAFGSSILVSSRKKFQLVDGEPPAQAAGYFDTVPVGRYDHNEDLGVGGQIVNGGGGAKWRRFQAGPWCLNPSLHFVPQRIDAPFEILCGRLRGSQAGCLIFTLADEGLSRKIHTLATPLGLGRFLFSKLNSLEMTLNDLAFARFDGAVRGVHCAMCRLDENRINTQAGALRTNTREHITNRDRPSVCTFHEMPGSNRVGANLIENLVLTFPRLEKRRRPHHNGSRERRLPIEDLGPMDNLILQHFMYGLK